MLLPTVITDIEMLILFVTFVHFFFSHRFPVVVVVVA